MNNDFLKIVEVGPRDGLQNEPNILTPDVRASWINSLYRAGFRNVEVGSVVRADKIPQMANSEEVFDKIERPSHCDASVLVPNLRGLERITSSNITEIGVFTAASDTFNLHNINCTIDESISRIRPLVEEARRKHLKVRGTVSCIVKCPYEGDIDPAKVIETCEALLALGCDEIVLGDTIGAATPPKIKALLSLISQSIAIEKIALHAHDTYDNAILNVAESLEYGVRIVDAATAGLGGCPYAPGAKGNVSSGAVVDFCIQQGLATGIDRARLEEAENMIHQAISTSE